jgi:hypothetical protein
MHSSMKSLELNMQLGTKNNFMYTVVKETVEIKYQSLLTFKSFLIRERKYKEILKYLILIITFTTACKLLLK